MPRLVNLRRIIGFLLLGGSLALNSARGQTVLSGTYNGASITGDVAINYNTSATFTGGSTFSGANFALGDYATLYWNQNGTLVGKALTSGATAGYTASIIVGTGYTLTFDSATTLTGDAYVNGNSTSTFNNYGTITQTSATGTLRATTLNNYGTITANAGSNLYVGDYYNLGTTNQLGGSITATDSTTVVHLRDLANLGTLFAQNNGILEFEGLANTVANLGTVQLSTGGRALLNGTFDNTSTTLNAPSGGTYELYGGIINHGTIGAGALTFTSSGGTLSNVSYAGNLTLGYNTSVTFTNGTTFTGTTASLGDYATLYWYQNGTLAGKTITSGVTPGYTGSIYLNTGNSLTFDSATTLSGDVYVYGYSGSTFTNYGGITQTSGTGTLYAPTLNNYGTITANSGSNLYIGDYYNLGATNQSGGSITATGSNTVMHVRDLANLGTLFAQNNGILEFEGTANTIANLGSVQLSTGGRALLNGTFDNTSTTLNAPSGGTYELYGGIINHGTIGAGALTFTSSGGTLSNVSYAGNLTLGYNTSVTFTNGTTFTGATASLGDYATIYWNQNGTLAGKAITSGVTPGYYSALYIGSSNSLTFDSATTLTGDIYLYGYSSSTFNNYGSLTQTSGTGTLYAPTLNNYGSITANAGSNLYVGDYYNLGATNQSGGSITATGSNTVMHVRDLANLGTLFAQNNGILEFEGNTNTIANLGSVQLSTGGRALLNGIFDNTSTTLTAPSGGVYELYGGTINNGTIDAGALTFTSSGGTIANATLLASPLVIPAGTSVTLSNDILSGDLSLGYNSSLTLTNGTFFPGSNLNLSDYATLYWNQNGTLAGKTITFGVTPGYYAAMYIYTNKSLTVDNASTLTGDIYLYGYSGSTFNNYASLTQTSGTGTLYAPTLNNYGVITANSGSTLYIGDYSNPGFTNQSGGSITAYGTNTVVHLRDLANLGTLFAQNNGILQFEGTGNAIANLGSVQLSTGGRALLNGTFDNTSTTLNAPSGGTYELYGGTINNGTISAGALTFTSSGGTIANATLLASPLILSAGTSVTLSNDTLQGNIILGGSSSLTLTNGTFFPGSMLNLGDYSTLYWNQDGTLVGKTIISGATAGYYAAIYLYSGHTLTFDSATSLTGDIYFNGYSGSTFNNYGTIAQTSGTGTLYAPTLSNYGTITTSAGSSLYIGDYYNPGFTNQSGGSITATGTNSTVHLRDVANLGTLYAQNNGILEFEGVGNTTANLGLIQLSTGGRALLNGTFDNTSATLGSITGGLFELYGGTINNGNIAAGMLGFTSSGGTLSGVTINGDLAMAASSAYAYFTNGTTFTGANGTLAANTGIYWQQSGTLAGKTLSLGTNAYIYVVGANHTLTLDPATTLTGSANVYAGSTTGTVITNQGSITNTTGNGSLYAGQFTNNGTITATGGTLSLSYNSAGYNFANPAGGAINVNGATVYLQSPLTNAGTINVQSGNFYAYNLLTNGSTGLIQGSGNYNGNLVMAGGTLAPGNSVGTLTFTSSNFSVTNSAILSIEVSGASADKVAFVSPTANVDIGSGLLALSLQLLSAPTPGTTYTIMSISGGAYVFSGRFAGLPNNGDSLVASFAAQNYTFTVNYLSNAITLDFAAVPEPGTWALLGTGLGVLALGGRRRRR